MQTIHYVLVVCAALAAGLPSFAEALPPQAAPYVKALTASLVLIVGVLGAVSPQADVAGKIAAKLAAKKAQP